MGAGPGDGRCSLQRRSGSDDGRAHRDPRERPGRPGMGRRPRRRRALVCRTAIGGAHRRHGAPTAHRSIAKRAGLARSAPVSPPPVDLTSGVGAPVDCGLRVAGGALWRRAHAGLHPLAPRAARADRTFPARARRRDASRPLAVFGGGGRGRCASPGIGRGGRHQLRDRHRDAGPDTGLLARRRQQHRRVGRSRLRVDVPPCMRADDGASEPLCRRHGDLQRRGIRVLRVVGCLRRPAAA